MKLINCGCSFAHGYNSNIIENYTPLQQKGLDKLKVNGYESIGWHLSQLKNFEYVDLARNGNSNEGIVRTLRTYLSTNNDDSFVLIGWTHAFRREYFTWNVSKSKAEPVQYREIPMAESFFSKMANKFHKGSIGPTMVEFNERQNRPLAYDDHIEYRKYNLILQTQHMLQLMKIPYLMYNGCGNEQDSLNFEVKNIRSQIDKKFFYDLDGLSLDQYVLKNKKYLSEDGGHPNPLGHKKWAELLAPLFLKIVEENV